MSRVSEIDGKWEGSALAAARAKLLESCRKSQTEKGGTGGDNAFYGGALKSGTLAYYEYPCHYNTRYLVDCEVMFSRFVHPKTSKTQAKAVSEATKAWFKFITGPTSPWRQVFAGMPVDRPESRPLWQWRYGFLFDNLDTVPGNLLQSFLVATRMPKEWTKHIIRWHSLVKAGVSPAAAAFYEPMFWEEDGGVKNKWYGSSNRYDYPLDHATCDAAYVQNFCAGVLVNSSKPWSQIKKAAPWNPESLTMEYWPVNSIFGNNDIKPRANGRDWISKSYAYWLRDHYSPLIGTRTEKPNLDYRGISNGKPPLVEWKCTQEQQIELFKTEERRLGLV